MVDYNKPLGISLLAYLLFTLALIIISAAVYVFFYDSEFWETGILNMIESRDLRFMGVIGFALLIAVSGIGLLKTSPSGRVLLVVLGLVTGIHGLIVAQSDLMRGFIIIGICIAVLAYMFSSNVSEVFRPMDSRKAVDSISALESYHRVRSYK